MKRVGEGGDKDYLSYNPTVVRGSHNNNFKSRKMSPEQR